MLGGIAGSWSAVMVELLAQWLAGADDARVILLDAAMDAERNGGWTRVEVDWPERDDHGTGNNPHVWFETTIGESRLPASQCTCGAFKHEAISAPTQFREHPRAHGKSAAMRTEVARRVRAGQSVLVVRPEGDVLVDSEDALQRYLGARQ